MKIPSSDRQAQRATCLGRPPQLLGPLSPLAVGITLLLSGAAQADTFTYDALNRMTQAVTPSASETYVYGEGEGRIKKVNGTLTTYYIDADYEENWNGSTKTEVIKHYFAGAQRVATRDNEGLKYQHPDHLGSASRATDALGTQVRAFWYDPYGSQAATSGSATVKYQYTDKEHDQTNLYDYGARYYDPALGRFLSADSLLPNLYDPQQLNRYGYARNNPAKLIDPSGHQVMSPPLLAPPAAGPAAIFPGFDLASWDPFGVKAWFNEQISKIDPRQYAPYVAEWFYGDSPEAQALRAWLTLLNAAPGSKSAVTASSAARSPGVVRHLEAGDVDALTQFALESGQLHKRQRQGSFTATWLEFARRVDHMSPEQVKGFAEDFFLHQSGGKILGAMRTYDGEDAFHIAYLEAMGGGAGTTLVYRAVHESMNRGFQGRTELVAAPGSDDFYRKLGFVQVGDTGIYQLNEQGARRLLRREADQNSFWKSWNKQW